MKYQAYPEYKDSGVEWIGDIPADWDMWKIAHACPYVASGTTPKADGEIYYGGENLWVTTGELRESVIFNTQKKVTDKALIDMPTLRIHPKGSVAIAMYGATIGRLGIFGNDATTNQACCVMPPSEILHNKYLFYWLYATRQEIINLSSGGGQPNVNQEKIASLKVSVPDYLLQENIANFLDHETAKIDTLIEKQQQLIKLLKEKRQAVISHAVTKGLNPNAPMRDSGVEWLGEVPEHWEVKRIGLLFTESSVRAFSDVELQYPVLSVSIHHGISDKELNEEELDRKVTRSEDKSLYKIVHTNDLAYNMMRAWQGGFGASKLSGLVSPAYVVCQPKTLLNSYYFELTLRTPNAVTELKRYSRGITDFRLRLYWDEFKNIYVPVPPDDEIETILNSIVAINLTFDKLVIISERQIELLQERRTALISAAVTGKIDVRNFK
ncbi:MAG: restriction endonuclease subunit S [Methylobacter sp.]|uniref:Restriction endonuclease subunit S n=1 Tax=Candidatus Methylobacter titanis TaxID=3053457 RepID=A0AA43TJC6_9GAMM|nr:restriction endonuclease subunit S [Candidatus Methylobacter titanis]